MRGEFVFTSVQVGVVFHPWTRRISWGFSLAYLPYASKGSSMANQAVSTSGDSKVPSSNITVQVGITARVQPRSLRSR